MKPLMTNLKVGTGRDEMRVCTAREMAAIDRETIAGGVAGLILDGRGRPLALPEDDGGRRVLIANWLAALGLQTGEVA